MSWTRSGNMSSEPSKETPERWEVRLFSGQHPCARPGLLQPLPPRPVPLTLRALLDVVAGDKGGAAGFGQPHAQGLAAASAGFPHQKRLQGTGVRGSEPLPLASLSLPHNRRRRHPPPASPGSGP